MEILEEGGEVYDAVTLSIVAPDVLWDSSSFDEYLVSGDAEPARKRLAVGGRVSIRLVPSVLEASTDDERAPSQVRLNILGGDQIAAESSNSEVLEVSFTEPEPTDELAYTRNNARIVRIVALSAGEAELLLSLGNVEKQLAFLVE